MNVIPRPKENEFPPHAKAYVEHVPADDVIAVLAGQVERTVALVGPLGDDGALRRYAPGKWTVKETVGHISDTERVLSYRILRIARGDATPLPGFEQDGYVANAASNERALEDLLKELRAVRQSTLSLVRSLPMEAWNRGGTASGFPVTARGLLFTLAGHELHHFQILRDKYLTP